MALPMHLSDTQSVFGESSSDVVRDFRLKFDNELETRIKQEADEIGEDADCPYPFETDQAALKDNKDYQSLLRSLVVLEAQRTMALRDYETLIQLQRDALCDPITFVHKLQQKVDLGIPKPQKVAELPSIDWENYSGSLKTVFNSSNPRHLTRRKYKREMHNEVKEENDDLLPSSEYKESTMTSHSMSSILSETEDVPRCLERGEEEDGEAGNSKLSLTGTFNQPWSVEEQKVLEALLVKYPPERFESRRWAKIAEELGNRTPQQVASRVQKYFIKLAKMSLPIPGRTPNLAAYGGKGAYHKHQRYNHFYYPSSTFMASYEPPVFMPEDDGDTTGSYSINRTSAFPFRAGQMSNSTRELIERQEFAKSSREFGICQNTSFTIDGQTEHRCIACGCLDSSVWWQCIECPTESIILCTTCSKQEFVRGQHNSRHLLNRINS